MEICITSCGDKWDTWKSFVLGGELFFTQTFSLANTSLLTTLLSTYIIHKALVQCEHAGNVTY